MESCGRPRQGRVFYVCVCIINKTNVSKEFELYFFTRRCPAPPRGRWRRRGPLLLLAATTKLAVARPKVRPDDNAGPDGSMRLDLLVRRARWAAWSGALPLDGVDQQASRRVELRAFCAQGKVHALTTEHAHAQALLRHGHRERTAGSATTMHARWLPASTSRVDFRHALLVSDDLRQNVRSINTNALPPPCDAPSP